MKITVYQSLRFIILNNFKTDEYFWFFGKDQSDHATLESMFQEANGREWSAISGGFYMRYRSDLNPEIINGIRVDTIHLFDVSGSFGMNVDVLNDALPVLKHHLGAHTKVTHNYK